MATVRQDLLQMLAKEHRDHRDALHDLMTTTTTVPLRSRRRAFGMLTLRISTQLAAEDVLVHPLVAQVLPGGVAFVDARRAEMDLVMSGLADCGEHLTDDPSGALGTAAHAFVSYTDQQEVVGFLAVRQRIAPPWLRRLGRLHEHHRRMFPGRYLREMGSTHSPWTDAGLLQTCRGWYQQEASREGLDAEGAVTIPLEDGRSAGTARTAARSVPWTHR